MTNSILGDIAENIVNHFINVEVKHFSYDELKEAKKWILN
ncbi:STAS/SEC14 domain-containing protein [Arcobacter sp.]